MRIGEKLTLGVLLISLMAFFANAQAANRDTIINSFQDALNKVMYPDEVSMNDLTFEQIAKYIVPNAAKILADTIEEIYEKTHKDIGVEDVLSVLPPKIEDAFRAKKNINQEVMDILENTSGKK